MGTDIHSVAEICVDGVWQGVTLEMARPHQETKGRRAESNYGAARFGLWEPLEDRNYWLFGILCCVRGRDDLGYIAKEPRGKPKKMSPPVREFMKVVEHSPSWVTLEELDRFDFRSKTIELTDIVVPFGSWAEWHRAGQPRVWDFSSRYGMSRLSHRVMEHAEAIETLAPVKDGGDDAIDSAVRLINAEGARAVRVASVHESIAASMEEPLAAMEVLRKLQPDPTRGRFVFYFDS